MKHLCYKLDVITKTWHVYYLPKAKFELLKGKRLMAVAEPDDREIFVRVDAISRGDIMRESLAHELMHAYVHEHSATTINLESGQMEELCCDIVAKYGVRINSQAQTIMNVYKASRGHIISKAPKKKKSGT